VKLEKKLWLYESGEMSPSGRREIEAVLAEHDDLPALLKLYREKAAPLRDLDQPSPGRNLVATALRDVEIRESRRAPFLWRPAAALAAALLLLFGTWRMAQNRAASREAIARIDSQIEGNRAIRVRVAKARVGLASLRENVSAHAEREKSHAFGAARSDVSPRLNRIEKRLDRLKRKLTEEPDRQNQDHTRTRAAIRYA
jgi:hypothetical protein